MICMGMKRTPNQPKEGENKQQHQNKKYTRAYVHTSTVHVMNKKTETFQKNIQKDKNKATPYI